MEKTKIQFSADELRLIKNSEWILTKNAIIEKVCQGFGDLAAQMQQEVQNRRHALPDIVVSSTPKISRGEKYQGLPYVILDYPRVFGKVHILAIRTMFWWGNFYSVTLHVKGQFLPSVWKKITSSTFNGDHNMYISLSGNEWNHDLNSQDFLPFGTLQEMNLENIPADQSFIKLTVKIDVNQWDDIQKKMAGSFLVFLNLVEN